MVSPVKQLDVRFADPAAYGDLLAALLALLSIVAIRQNASWAIASVWIFNALGLIDLVNAVGRGIMYIPDGHFGAAFWIPVIIVPLLLVTHVYIFIRLFTSESRTASGVENYIHTRIT